MMIYTQVDNNNNNNNNKNNKDDDDEEEDEDEDKDDDGGSNLQCHFSLLVCTEHLLHHLTRHLTGLFQWR